MQDRAISSQNRTFACDPLTTSGPSIVSGRCAAKAEDIYDIVGFRIGAIFETATKCSDCPFEDIRVR